MTTVDSLDRVKAPESLRKGRVTKDETASWSARELEIRACCTCHVVYRSAGYAYSCEHWHQGV
jgi:hypothetical protein